MKRILSVLLLTAMLTACGTGTATTTLDAVSDDANTADVSVSGDEEADPEPDYSNFVFPEETDTLVVYSSDMLLQTMNPAIKIFEEMYPHINVDYQILTDSEQQDRLRVEIPAGAGPDLVFSYGIDLPDIYKTMATGVFCDLNPYLYNDEEFSFDDYITGTFTGSMMQGKQYIVPIQVRMPIVLTTMGILEENGISTESLDTYDGFLDACTIFKQNNPDSGIFDYGADEAYLSDLYENCGLNLINYANNTITMDKDAMNKFADVCKLYYNQKAQDPMAGDTMNSFTERKFIFQTYNTSSFLLINDICGVRGTLKDIPYATLVPDPYDGATAYMMTFAAIPNGSQNKLNAYRLLKILLSEEIQYGAHATLGMPVHCESFRKNYDSNVDQYIEWGFDDVIRDDVTILIEKCFSVTRTFASPSILRRYLKLEITPYLTGKRTFDECYDNLYTTIELYKDE